MYNFKNICEDNFSIPIGILLDTLFKQFRISGIQNYPFKMFDIEFFLFVSNHPKLTDKNAIELSEILLNVFIYCLTYAKIIIDPLINIFSK